MDNTRNSFWSIHFTSRTTNRVPVTSYSPTVVNTPGKHNLYVYTYSQGQKVPIPR